MFLSIIECHENAKAIVESNGGRGGLDKKEVIKV